MEKPVYLDHNATTPVDPEVFEAMKPFFLEHFGNASSRHEYGWTASKAVESARATVAQLIGSVAKEIYFTSGATESNNIAVRGALSEDKTHIVTSNVEHNSVLEVAADLEKKGQATVTVLSADPHGQVSPEQVRAALRPETALISLMYGNNEIATLNPIAAIGRLAKDRQVLFHTDATQSVGHLALSIKELEVDLLSLSAHKLHGPKGVGALFVRSQNPRVRLRPHSTGGSQELGLRPGTLNVPGIVGLGKACEIALRVLPEEKKRVSGLRDELQRLLSQGLEDIQINGHPTERLPHGLSVTFKNISAQSLLGQIHRAVALSTGSACTNPLAEISHVLKAIGLNEDEAHSTLRFGLGRFTTPEDIEKAANTVIAAVTKMRQSSNTYKTTPPPVNFRIK